jgi:signal peptidase I
LTSNKFRKLCKRETFKTAVTILLLVAVVASGYLALQLTLNTEVPIRVVGSGSMCTIFDGGCEGFQSLTHPFAHTLHTGDLIIVQGVKPEELKAAYPNSDIIVYKNPYGVSPIVHRILTSQVINNTLYFQTKGDGNPPTIWPALPNSYEYDGIPDRAYGVPANLVEGRVVMRIPFLGWIPLLIQNTNWALPLIIALVVLLVAVEFLFPVYKRKRTAQQGKRFQCSTDVFIKSNYDKLIFKAVKQGG